MEEVEGTDTEQHKDNSPAVLLVERHEVKGHSTKQEGEIGFQKTGVRLYNKCCTSVVKHLQGRKGVGEIHFRGM